MDSKNTIKTQAGGLLLEALMIAFLFVHSWSGIAANDKGNHGNVTISVAPAKQLLFRDSRSSSESFMEIIAKIQLVVSEISNIVTDVSGLEIATCEALLITHSLYNTFYTNTTINAP